jgi:hypothetical protein
MQGEVVGSRKESIAADLRFDPGIHLAGVTKITKFAVRKLVAISERKKAIRTPRSG